MPTGRAGPHPQLAVCREPLFEQILDAWRAPDLAALAPLFAAACDRHTFQSRYGSGGDNYDFNRDYMWYVAFEILAVLRLREISGRANPVLDHLLVQTPLGRLGSPVPPPKDALFLAVFRRLAEDLPGFGLDQQTGRSGASGTLSTD